VKKLMWSGMAVLCSAFVSVSFPADVKADGPPTAPPSFTISGEDTGSSDEDAPVPADVTDPDEPVPGATVNPLEPPPLGLPAAQVPQPVAPAAPVVPPQPAPTPPVAPPAKPAAPAAPAVPASPPGPPGGDVWIRDSFGCDWQGGPMVCLIQASHSSTCHFDYPGGQKDQPIPREPDDNSHLIAVTLEHFNPKGGDVTVVCYGIEPGHGPGRATRHVRAAPSSAAAVNTKVVAKQKKHGRKALRSKSKTVPVALPTAPAEVANSYHGYCGYRSNGTWGFSQAPLKGGAPSLWAPNVGNHCEPEKYHTSPAQWRAYLCAFWHCVDPRKPKTASASSTPVRRPSAKASKHQASRPKHKKAPPKKPKPAPKPAPVATTTTTPTDTCPYGLAGKDGQPGNDDQACPTK
jgi:hypothetical protein